MAALTLVVAQVDKVILFALQVLGLYAPRAARAVLQAVQLPLELGLEHQRVQVLVAVVLVVEVGKVVDATQIKVTAAVAVAVVINRVAERLAAVRARLHSPQAQMAHLAAVVVVVDLVTIAKLVAAVLAFY